MTLSSTSRPAIRGRALTRLPATLQATGGLQVEKVNGIWTFSPDWTALDLETSLPEPENRHLWVLNPDTEVYTRLSVSALMTSAFAGTSTTSLSVATGSKTFATQAGKLWSLGQRLRTASDDGATVMEGEVTAYSDTSLTIDVDRIEGSGTHADWNITIAGMPGQTAPIAGIRQTYDSDTTDADPGPGDFKLNHATPGSATAAYFDNLDTAGGTVSSMIDKWDDSTTTTKGFLRIEKENDAAVWADFTVTGSVVDGTGYRKLTLSAGSSNGTFTAGDAFRISFSRAGDQGIGDLVAANNLSDVASAATAFANIKQAASATATGVVELATDAETQTGTDTTRAVTPANLTAKEATTANYRANTADRILTTDQVWSAAAEASLTDAATIAVDFSTFINATVTLAGNRALGNPTNEKVGQTGYIRVVQDATGSRTLSYGTDWEFASGSAPTLSTAANAQDLLFYTVIGTDRILGSLVKAIA